MTADTLTLKAESPLALHRRRASEQFAPTLDYLPGSAVRGALADLYLAGAPERSQEADFKNLFLSGVVRFSDFLPIPSDYHGLAHLIPATAAACKRFSDHESTSLTDGLLRLELAREMKQADALEHNGWFYCPICQRGGHGERRDRLESGYYTLLEAFQRVPVRKRMVTTTAIERASGTAAYGMLYSHEVIQESDVHEDVLFRGVVTLPEELRSKLKELAGYGRRIAVGYGRSRGLGQVSVAGWGTAPVERQAVADRWAALNETARALWSLFDRQPEGEYFSLTLQSHLALRDDAGEPVLGEITAQDFGLSVGTVQCRRVLRAIAVPGWNAALDLPKPDTWALDRGSVLLFRLPPGHDREPVIDRLQEIEREGIGERRAEGFGRLTACDPFHFYFLQREP
ncbi:MAG: CRISPR-associated RAMP protein Csx10 [bacterium]|uniref:CRISPR-associated RAMP protein Csx10 n=1 Tax=Candidatus Methylomirabilis tolerans TaxID=3123416 RepID=A0AAJ1ELG3_9BACT|nr:CRISPR-associated RAMP protein Csx10 [Candidatus Methylomirabilis sp.]